MDEKEMKEQFEGFMKMYLAGKHPSIKIDYDFANWYPDGTLEIRDCPSSLLGMIFMQIFSEINDRLESKSAKDDFKEGLKVAVELYDKEADELEDHFKEVKDFLKEGEEDAGF